MLDWDVWNSFLGTVVALQQWDSTHRESSGLSIFDIPTRWEFFVYCRASHEYCVQGFRFIDKSSLCPSVATIAATVIMNYKAGKQRK